MFSRDVVVAIAAAALAGCGGFQPPMGAPGVVSQNGPIAPHRTIVDHNVSPPPPYQVLHSFGVSPNDGVEPVTSLINVKGTLYGITAGGGTYQGASHGAGTVFSISTTGTEHVLYSFGNGSDGAQPEASLINVNGTLYGTTMYGGEYNYGTVFSISTTGTEHVLYSFRGPPSDGGYPRASLINVNGTLYGTTFYGGEYQGPSNEAGTVFSITRTGTERVLHSFGNGSDGYEPLASLLDVKGTLYGTTSKGGGMYHAGTVFSITRTGTEHVLYSFSNLGYNYNPGTLINVNGLLYSTAGGDGTYGGMVFSITTTGIERVVYSFRGPPSDGLNPTASLINVNGTLYGTTVSGGTYFGYGTVFSVSPTGTEHVLHSFGSGTDGSGPAAALTNVNGALYGTTEFGGNTSNCAGSKGCGTIFALTP